MLFYCLYINDNLKIWQTREILSNYQIKILIATMPSIQRSLVHEMKWTDQGILVMKMLLFDLKVSISHRFHCTDEIMCVSKCRSFRTLYTSTLVFKTSFHEELQFYVFSKSCQIIQNGGSTLVYLCKCLQHWWKYDHTNTQMKPYN